ncbi:MAG: MerR family transcriptional regulator [Phycisphaerae bacterium]|nr:MerR family transcriptional regulator [Phycisphaerae bacterium]
MALRKIGAAAATFGISPRRLIEYERAGLLHPARDARTNDRVYADADMEMIRRILHLIHQQKFTLPAIQVLFSCAPCYRVRCCAHMENCPIPQNQLIPCYEQRACGIRACDDNTDCESCPKYHCRDHALSPSAV